MNVWLKHPRSNKPDTMLTFSALALAVCLIKFLLNGASVEVMGYSIEFGTVDAALVAALLTPTLAAYATRKWKDSPDVKKTTK